MEPGSLVLDETATPLTESKAKSSECGLAVVRDIYYLKLLAIEVVCQLALDTVSERPKDSPLFSQLVEQIQEEIDHLNQCRIFLSQRDALETSPPYVRRYSRVHALLCQPPPPDPSSGGRCSFLHSRREKCDGTDREGLGIGVADSRLAEKAGRG
jgi:hypothetical protein